MWRVMFSPIQQRTFGVYQNEDYSGVYHQISDKHLERRSDEFSAYFNTRL